MAGSPSAKRQAALDAARLAQRRAGSKVSRLRARGINVESIDPRGGDLSSMTTGQVQAYTRRLAAFTSRSNSYVAGIGGAPLSGNTWRQYQRAEARYNAASARFLDSVRNLRIPTINQTVSQYLDNLASKPGDYRTFNRLERSASNITSEKNLQALLKQMSGRDGNYLQREADLQRRIVNRMLRRTSNAELIPAVRDLSDEEVITLQYTEFMPALENSYDSAKSLSSGRPTGPSSVIENNQDTIETLLDWATNHFGRVEETSPEQDTDGPRSRTAPARDEYGRFVRRDSANPTPTFTRDAQGRFAPKRRS